MYGEHWRKYLDKDKHIIPDKVSELQGIYNQLLDIYIEENVKLVGEQPRVKGIWMDIPTPRKYTAYHTPEAKNRIAASFVLEEKFQELAVGMSDVITEGFQFFLEWRLLK